MGRRPHDGRACGSVVAGGSWRGEKAAPAKVSLPRRHRRHYGIGCSPQRRWLASTCIAPLDDEANTPSPSAGGRLRMRRAEATACRGRREACRDVHPHRRGSRPKCAGRRQARQARLLAPPGRPSRPGRGHWRCSASSGVPGAEVASPVNGPAGRSPAPALRGRRRQACGRAGRRRPVPRRAAPAMPSRRKG